MAAPARDALQEAFLAAVGAFALSAERIEQLAESLAGRGGIRREEAQAAIEDTINRWREDAVRVGERAGSGLQGAFRELGLVPRSEVEALELRVAQLEHRVRLLERDEELALPPG
ncbi:MAG: phasin family protein [Gaiellaceae bacterium]